MDGGAWWATVHRKIVRRDLGTKHQQQQMAKQCWASLFVFTSHLYIFFGEKDLNRSFAHFFFFFLCPFLSCVVFLLLSWKSSSYTWISNIFFHSLDCLFTFLLVSFEGQVFNLGEIQFIYCFFLSFFLITVFLVSYLKNHCLVQGLKDLHPCFLLRFLYSFITRTEVFDPFGVNFCIWCEVGFPSNFGWNQTEILPTSPAGK